VSDKAELLTELGPIKGLYGILRYITCVCKVQLIFRLAHFQSESLLFRSPHLSSVSPASDLEMFTHEIPSPY